MTTLTWQTLLLLAVTYFTGCCLGCLARRSAWRRRMQPALRQVPQSAAPMVAGTSVIPVVADRVEMPTPVLASRSATATSAEQPAREPFRRADTAAPSPEPAKDAPAALSDASRTARFERALDGARQGDTQPHPVAAPAAVEPDVARDDLQRIKAIDAAMAATLQSLGIATFADMAQWTAADVARVSRQLGFKGRIEQENWIEQAQVLARGGETRYAQRMARGEIVAARRVEDEGEPRSPAMTLAPSSQPEPKAPAPVTQDTPDNTWAGDPDVSDRAAFARAGLQETEGLVSVETEAARFVVAPEPLQDASPARTGDDLQRIRGIDAEIEALVKEHGVTRYSQISSWSRVDTARFDGLVGETGRIARENWIEQAQILAKGGDTAFSRDYDRRMPGEATTEASAGRAATLAVLRSVRSEAYHPGRDGAVVRGRPDAPDDLKRIRGIGLLIEKDLNRLGIASYEHIANWTAADIDRVSQVLDFKGRIERENWVEQARILASGGQTEFSRRIDRGTMGSGGVSP